MAGGSEGCKGVGGLGSLRWLEAEWKVEELMQYEFDETIQLRNVD